MQDDVMQREWQAGCRGPRCLLRRQISERTVRSLFVVLAPPESDLAPCVEQVVKPAHVQELVPKLAMEAFNAAILCRLSGLNVQQFDSPFHRPREEVARGQLRSVIAANAFRPAVFQHRLVENTRHAPARKTGVRFERDALAAERIDNAQHADRAPRRQPIGGEVDRPFLVHLRNGLEWAADANQTLAFAPPHAQSGFAVHAPDALVIDDLTVPPEQDMQPPIAIAGLVPREFNEPLTEMFVIPNRAIAKAGYGEAEEPAGAPRAEVERGDHMRHVFSQICELQPFFRMTDCSASLSRLRSATSFLSRAFSSRSCRASCAWLTSMPPYFAFQA